MQLGPWLHNGVSNQEILHFLGCGLGMIEFHLGGKFCEIGAMVIQ